MCAYRIKWDRDMQDAKCSINSSVIVPYLCYKGNHGSSKILQIQTYPETKKGAHRLSGIPTLRGRRVLDSCPSGNCQTSSSRSGKSLDQPGHRFKKDSLPAARLKNNFHISGRTADHTRFACGEQDSPPVTIAQDHLCDRRHRQS